jgi:DUF1680 family protein
VISGISLAGDRFFYTNPLEADGKYAFNHGACTRQSWFDCSCCPTNLIRFIPSVPGLIYATFADSLFINLFVSNEAIVRLTETDIQVSQKTDYPWNGDISISVSPSEKRKFSIKLRVPCWANNKPLPGNLYKYVYSGSEKISLKINGEEEDPIYKNGYIDLTRKWGKGDVIDITYPMEVRRVAAHENISENKNLIAIERGPIVYCAEEIDNPGDFSQLTIPADAEFQVEKREDLLKGVNVIRCICQTISRDTANNIVLVPYYAWSNRGIGKMKVWIQD